MQVVAALGMGAFFLVASLVAVRMLLLWRRTRGVPELCLGLSLLCIGPLGYSVMRLVLDLWPTNPDLAHALSLPGTFMLAFGASLNAVFAWRVFRSQSAAARVAALGLCALILALWLANQFLGLFDAEGAFTPLTYLNVAARTIPLIWCTVEALVYWRRMVRRVALGLSDPLVASRVLLWGIGSGAGAAVVLASMAAMHSYNANGASVVPPGVELALTVVGFVAAIAFWLAFLTPAFWKRWVLAGTG